MKFGEILIVLIILKNSPKKKLNLFVKLEVKLKNEIKRIFE